MTAPTDALLPCPFCGAPGYVERSGRGYWVAGCDGMECALAPLCTDENQVTVIAAWNRRADAADTTAGERR